LSLLAFSTVTLATPRAAVADVRKRLAEVKKPRDATNKELAELGTHEAKLLKDKRALEGQIKAANDERRKHAQGDERKLRDQVDGLRSSIEAKDAEIRSLRSQQGSLQQAFETARDVHQSARSQAKGTQSSISAVERQIQNLRGSRQAPARQFGPKVPEILSAIHAHAASFEAEVVGPVGQYVKFNDARHEEWSTAVSACVGKTLRNFVVASQNDRKVRAPRAVLDAGHVTTSLCCASCCSGCSEIWAAATTTRSR
jgi:chromosome segregation ATPase